jgi:hypothetical protein
MVEHEGHVRRRVGQRRHLQELRVVDPGLERKAELAELGEALAERRQREQPRRRRGVAAADVGAGIERGGMADALEAAVPHPDVALQHFGHRGALGEVGAADDAFAGENRAIAAARRHRRDAADELGLADEAHRLRPAGSIERAALDEDGALDVVAAGQVAQQLWQQVAALRKVPEVMVRIADRELRLEDRFGHGVILIPPCPSGEGG